MSRNTMRAVLFSTFTGIMLITVALTAYATIVAVGQPDSEPLWAFVRFTWTGVLLEVTGFLIALAYNLFGLRSHDLAREIAAKWAQEIVTHSKGDPAALNTSYWDTKKDFPIHFRSQGKNWLRVLDKEFQAEAIRESRRFPGLRGWRPSAKPPDLGPVELIQERKE